MDRYLYVDNISNDYLDNSGEEDNIFFTKDKINQCAIVNFDNYQITPIKIDNLDIETIIKLKFVDKIFKFDCNKSYFISIIITLISLIIGITSCLPLAGYQGDIELLTLFDFVTCIIKAICGGLIFIGCWYNSINKFVHNIYIQINKKEYDDSEKQIYGDFFKESGILHYIKKISIIFFASLYALPYAWDYWISPNTLIKNISVPLYFLSLLLVFYNRTIEQFKSSDNTFTIGRKKNILLDSINRVIKKSKEDPEITNKIIEILTNDINDIKFSVIFSVNDNYIFYDKNKEELTELYEEDNYDRFKSIRKTLLNFLLGIIYISLLITLIYQYQNLLVDILITNSTTIIDDPNTILWIAIWISIIESGLFILATYSIHYNYITELLKLGNCSIIKNKIYKLIIYSPMISAGIILAITRLQSSYIAYAVLVTLLELRKDMGFFLIVVGMALSFSIEMNFMIKTCVNIINMTLRNILTSQFIPECLLRINYINNKRNLALVVIYGKKMKKIINSLNDEGINFLMKTILHR
jgi:hypothetical protein